MSMVSFSPFSSLIPWWGYFLIFLWFAVLVLAAYSSRMSSIKDRSDGWFSSFPSSLIRPHTRSLPSSFDPSRCRVTLKVPKSSETSSTALSAGERTGRERQEQFVPSLPLFLLALRMSWAMLARTDSALV
jgi:hypothetical protein